MRNVSKREETEKWIKGQIERAKKGKLSLLLSLFRPGGTGEGSQVVYGLDAMERNSPRRVATRWVGCFSFSFYSV